MQGAYVGANASIMQGDKAFSLFDLVGMTTWLTLALLLLISLQKSDPLHFMMDTIKQHL